MRRQQRFIAVPGAGGRHAAFPRAVAFSVARPGSFPSTVAFARSFSCSISRAFTGACAGTGPREQQELQAWHRL